jgi:flagellar basal-body rod protein FlgC
MGLMSSMQTSASGLHAERFRMDVVAHNLANSSTTRTDSGEPFRRRMVVFAEDLENGLSGVRVDTIELDKSPGPMVKDPDNPRANADGMVEGSNVNPVLEMVDLIGATRAYEANITAFNAAKDMVARSLEIGSA